LTVAAVVTGFGHVGASGLGRDALSRALAEGTPRAATLEVSAGWHAPGSARTAFLCADANLTPWVTPAAARRMSRPSRLAVAAARMALEDAAPGCEPDGVVLATAFGPAAFTEKLLREILADPETASPFLFTECVANAPTAEVALALAARGTNWTITQREAGPVLALARAASEIDEGRARAVVAGAVEEMTPMLHGVLDRFRALARPGDDGEVARPFDARRNGFLAAEGATVWLVEDEGDAARRGARPLARVIARGAAFDPTATPGTWGRDGAGLGRAMRRSLERAGIDRTTIGVVVSGASGAVDGDRAESQALRALFDGEALPPVLAPKATLGEFGGAYLAAAFLAFAPSTFAATPGFRTPDPRLGIVPWQGGLLSASRALVTALASGGAAAWVLLERP
jgi:3-oxoacyl-[acyl-carrier-protein] synthase II